jgi:hypothetical protein
MVSQISVFVLPPPIAGGYGFSYLALAMLYFAPMIGTLVAEIWGHWFNDFLANRYLARYSTEVRLAAVYPAVLIGVGGLILFGETLEHHLSWVGLAFGWAMLCFGTLASISAISSYTLDVFPSVFSLLSLPPFSHALIRKRESKPLTQTREHAALASAWLCAWRVVGGFTVNYFQPDWIARNGPAVTFGCQAAIIGAAAITIAVTQYWGRSWRAKYPPPPAEN